MVSLDSGAARAALARQGIDYTEWVFFNAASVGYLETVQLFVEAGMSVNIADNEYGATALHGRRGLGVLRSSSTCRVKGRASRRGTTRVRRRFFGRQGAVICRWCVFWLSTARTVAEGVSLPALPDAGIGKWILDQELDPIDDTLNIFAIFGSRIVHP